MNLKKHLVFPFFLLFLYGGAQIPPSIQWETHMGGSNRDQAESILRTNDGGYIIAGWTDSNDGDVSQNSGGWDAWVVKLDANGNLSWEKSYGGSGTDYAYDIRQTTDGGYVMAGANSSQSANGDFDVWVVKLDAFGNLLWDVTYGGSDGDSAFNIEQTADGGYIVVGETSSNDGDVSQNNGNTDAWVLKLNPNGTLVWEQNYGGEGTDAALDIQQTIDGGYIVGGTSRSTNGDVPKNQGLDDTWVFKLTSTGNLTWSKTYGGTGYDRLGCGVFTDILGGDFIQQTSDGGYIVVGGVTSIDGDIGQNNGGGDLWIYKLDANGNLVWEQTYGGTNDDSGVMLQETLDGNFIVAAQTMSNNGDVSQNQGMTDYWVFKIDPMGNLLWEQTYGGSNRDLLSSIQQVSGCEFILAGHSDSNNGDVGGNQGMKDMWVVKLQMQWPPPTVSSPQNFCWSENATLADVPVTGDPQPGFLPVFTWYDDNVKTNILSETTILADGENYYVSQTIDGCESPLAEVLVNITDPVPTAVSPQEFCEDEQAFVSDIAVTGQNLVWYEDAGAANPISGNTPLQDGQTYYVSQTIDNCESSLLPIGVEIFPPPTAFPSSPLVRCDEDSDGFEEFYLPDLDAVITGGAANVTVTYHLSLSDAENAANPLPDTYTNTESPSQTIFACVLNTVTGCDNITEVELVVSPVPEIIDLEDLMGCDNGNGEAVFDLLENNDNILGNQNPQNLKITYHEISADAENGDNAIPNSENYTSANKTMFVRLENTVTGCFATGSFAIVVNPRPGINAVQLTEEFCSDEQGGSSATVDLSVYDAQINPNAPTGTEVVYYANLNDHTNGNAIEDAINYTTTANPQTLIAEVVDTTTGCPSLKQAEITIMINDRPVVDLRQYNGLALCWDSDLSTPVEGGNYDNIILETGLNAAEHTFTWTLNGTEVSETSPDLEAAEPGVYTVTVTDTDGVSTTCSSSSTATIIEANPPEFQLERTTEIIASGHALLVANVTGKGGFEFRVDDGTWTPLGEDGILLFTDINPGFHTVYGRSLEGCGTTAHNITLIGYPKFFTPNEDGQNDRWNIIGLENQPNAKIRIFDRYGKLLRRLNPAAPGWDGTYNGKRMPSNDYWFRVDFTETLSDGTERSQVFKAHFTLKR